MVGKDEAYNERHLAAIVFGTARVLGVRVSGRRGEEGRWRTARRSRTAAAIFHAEGRRIVWN